MYFPYLRGKQFELEALLEVNPNVYQNTLPILEPINLTRSNLGLYTRLTNQNVPIILIVNPYYPRNNTLTTASVQNLIDNQLSSHNSLSLGFIIDQRFDLTELNLFLTSNANRNKALIFRSNPIPADLNNIQNSVSTYQVDYLIFDDTKTTSRTRAAFGSHSQLVLLTDGFQRQDRNADYPLSSSFSSNYDTWQLDGWFGIGDYLTIGDNFREGGGQAYVISLHITVHTSSGLVTHHFSSTIYPTSTAFPADKFAEANNLLYNSAHLVGLNSTGLTLYRNWYTSLHNPQLGAAKKASIMHHIELISSLI
jgi:hypothetical protein